MIDDLCSAVIEQINAVDDWDPAFTVTFDDAPSFDAEHLKTLTVTLAPGDIQQEPSLRGRDKYTLTVDLCFQQKAGARPANGPDPLAELRKQLTTLQQTVANWLSERINRRPPEYNTAVLKKIVQQPIYDAGILRERRHYIGVMRLVYEEIEAP